MQLTPNHSMLPALNWPLLGQLAPPDFVLHLGAGSGSGPLHQWRDQPVPHALFIDADPARLTWVKTLTDHHPGWHSLAALIAATTGPATYHRASNPDENGLFPPASLTSLWPNLSELDRAEQPALSLATLLNEPPAASLPAALTAAYRAAEGIWVLIDCLPAAALLRGAAQEPERWSLVCARVRLDSAADADADSHLDTLQRRLAPWHFRPVALLEGHHSAIGHVLFLREWRAVLKPRLAVLEQENVALAQAREEQAQVADQHKAETDKQAQLATERGEQLKQATQTKEQAQTKIDELTKALDTAQAERDQQAKIAAQHQAETDKQAQLATERAEQLKQATQAKDRAQTKIDELTKALDTAQADRDQQAKIAAQHQAEADQQAKLATERTEQLAEREQAYAALVRDNAIALRLQQLREADLKDLQQRHAQVVDQKQQQETLLKQLTERLTAAAGYLHAHDDTPSELDTHPRPLIKPPRKSGKKRRT